MKSSLPFDSYLQDMAYKYGQNIGIAFQLVDDWLDFMSSADMLGKHKFFKSHLFIFSPIFKRIFSGKPSAADLSLGLATAPVLFASEQFPELNRLILRRFSQPGDVETAFRQVLSQKVKLDQMTNICWGK